MTQYKITQLSLESDGPVRMNVQINPEDLPAFDSPDQLVNLLRAYRGTPIANPSPTFGTPEDPFPQWDRTPATSPTDVADAYRAAITDPPLDHAVGGNVAAVPESPWDRTRRRIRDEASPPTAETVRTVAAPDNMGDQSPTQPERRPPSRSRGTGKKQVPVGGNRNKDWTPEREAELMSLVRAGWTVERIARQTQREVRAIQQRIRQINKRDVEANYHLRHEHQQPRLPGHYSEQSFLAPASHGTQTLSFNGGDVSKENAPEDHPVT
jgi:hypothetical protein